MAELEIHLSIDELLDIVGDIAIVRVRGNHNCLKLVLTKFVSVQYTAGTSMTMALMC